MRYCVDGEKIIHDPKLGTATPEMAAHLADCPQCRMALESEKKNTKPEGIGSKVTGLILAISRRLG